MEKNEIPDKVSWMVADAWNVNPPCTNPTNPFCHAQCPYYYECNTPEYDDTSEPWDED